MPEAEIPLAVAKAGGFGFVAHPWSKGARILERYGRFVKRGWPHGWQELDGDEHRGHRALERHDRRVGGLARPGRRDPLHGDPEAQLDGPRPEDVVAWDRICERRRFVAIGGLDAHQHGIRRARPPLEPDEERPLLPRCSRPTSR